MVDPNFWNIATFPVCAIKGGKIAIDARLNLFDPLRSLVHRVVAVPVVYRFEPAAIDSDNGLGEQAKPLAQHDELVARCPDCWAVLAPEVGDRLEVGRQPADQSHQFDIALRLALKTSARLNPVQVAVKVDLEHRRGMVGRSSRASVTPANPNACRSSLSMKAAITRTGLSLDT
jgi:hypothetical protein